MKKIVANHVRPLKYKRYFAKGYTLYWSEEMLGIKKAKYIVPRKDLNTEKLVGTFYEKKINQGKLNRVQDTKSNK